MNRIRHNVVLAIAPTSRGFGYAVFATPQHMLDWGVKETRREKNQQSKAKIGRMISEIKPTAVTIENWVHGSCRRSTRVRTLLLDVVVVAHRGGATVYTYSRRHVRSAFGQAGKSKDAIAAAIVDQLPALRAWLPRRRRIWESEHYSMAIFEAAALAVTHLITHHFSKLPKGVVAE